MDHWTDYERARMLDDADRRNVIPFGPPEDPMPAPDQAARQAEGADLGEWPEWELEPPEDAMRNVWFHVALGFLIWFAAGLLVVILTTGRAEAQPMCAPREAITDLLRGQYAEARIGAGLSSARDQLVELWVAESGTWTIIATDAHGRTCAVAAGTSWEDFPAPRGERG